MTNERFQVCQQITAILAWFIKLRTNTKLQSFDGQEPVLMWPYLSQFVTHSIDFAHLELFHNAVLRLMAKLKIA